jgi:hypothetical protein
VVASGQPFETLQLGPCAPGSERVSSCGGDGGALVLSTSTCRRGFCVWECADDGEVGHKRGWVAALVCRLVFNVVQNPYEKVHGCCGSERSGGASSRAFGDESHE